MAIVNALNGFSINMADLNFNRIDAGFYDSGQENNLTYKDDFYSDVLEYVWSYDNTYYSSIFGGSFTTALNESGTPVPTSGTITGYIEQVVAPVSSGTSWQAYLEITGTSVSATQFYDALLTPATNDDYGVIAQMLSGVDAIAGGSYGDTLYGYGGNDVIAGGLGDDTIDGGTGDDYAAYYYTYLDEILISKNMGGGYTTVTANDGTDTLTNIEFLIGVDGSSSTISTLYDAQTAPNFNYINNDVSTSATMSKYDGIVNWLDFYFYGADDRQTVSGTDYSEFFNLLGGTDAVDGRGGDDVLDGGTGSNFMTGGTGKDTFFIDGRESQNTWSTITDLTSNDAVTLWGWQNGVSQLIATQEDQGADGFKGVTYFYDLDGNGEQETKLTFTGLTESELNDPSVNTGAAVPHLSFSLATLSGVQITVI